MPVNLPLIDPAQLHAVAGVRWGITEAGVRKADRKDLTVVLIDGTPDWDVVRERFDAVSRTLPMFRQRVVPTPGGTPPRWASYSATRPASSGFSPSLASSWPRTLADASGLATPVREKAWSSWSIWRAAAAAAGPIAHRAVRDARDAVAGVVAHTGGAAGHARR